VGIRFGLAFNGHGWLFFFGIFLPILWIFGPFSDPKQGTASA
jgi:hypothetical protein